MPLTRCSRASWSTSGLAVLPGGRRRGGGRLALGWSCLLAGGVRGVSLRRGALGRRAPSRAAPGRAALGRAAPGTGLLGAGLLGCALLGGALLSGALLGGPLLGAGLLGGAFLARAVLDRRVVLRRGVLGGTVILGGGLVLGGPGLAGSGGGLARPALVGPGLGGLAVGGLGLASLAAALDLEVLDGLGNCRGERFPPVRARRGRLQGALGAGQALELLPVAGDLQKLAHRVRRLRADRQPVLGTVGVDLDEGRIDLGVILAYLLDRPAVPLGAGVGDDDPVKRRTDLAQALELDLDSHG